MAALQTIQYLVAPQGAPVPQPTLASPCPSAGFNTSQIQGAGVYSNAANPAGQSEFNYTWKLNNQFVTGTFIAVTSLASIVSAS